MKTRYFLAAGLAGLGCIIWLAVAHPLGLRFSMGIWPVPQATPWTYQLLSGFLAALTVLSLAGAVIGAYHHENCHEPRCWRIGKHKVNGTPWCGIHQEKARPEVTENELLTQILAELAGIRALLSVPAPSVRVQAGKRTGA